MNRFLYSLLIVLFTCGANMVNAQQNLDCVGEEGHVTWSVFTDIEGYDLQDLYGAPAYPLSPTFNLELLSLQSTYNFSNHYGSVIRGFIKAPETKTYEFNVTGTDRVNFYMSSGTNPDNVSLMAFSPGGSWIDDHYIWPEQTSAPQNLIEDRYYYIEIHHKEDWWSDHAQVYWREFNGADTLWRIVTSNDLYDYTCATTCPTAGTPCNDGDPNSTNDAHDGYCNCIGEYTSSNPCVGVRGSIQALKYDSITSGGLNALYNAPKYPLAPDTTLFLDKIYMPGNIDDYYGTLIKGFIRVPISGTYTLNLTGDDQTRFYLSSDDDPGNTNLVCEVNGWTQRSEHYKYPEQTSAELTLSNDQFYYFELHHKEGGGGDHSTLYWRPPFSVDSTWKIVTGAFLYEYACELACVPEGTPCDDHDDTTDNDQYDSNCDCVGTPCGGPCHQVNSYNYAPSCKIREEVANHPLDSWLSCQETSNPNPSHGNSHFIMYDFGSNHKITRCRYWNYNVDGETGKGAKTVVIDFSENASNWTNLGTYTWPEASGFVGYTGDSIPDLNGVKARYILFTITESWSDPTCAGFSEILFDVRKCFQGGTPCDDGNPNTHGDMYDNFCNCVGIPDVVENPCDTPLLSLTQTTLPSGDYNAEISINSISEVDQGEIVTFTGGQEIDLNPGFDVKKGALFYASIEPCVQPLEPAPIRPLVYEIQLPVQPSEQQKEKLKLSEIRNHLIEISYKIQRSGVTSLYVENSKGERVFTFMDNLDIQKGQYSKQFPTRGLTADIYQVVLQTPKNNLRQRLTVLKIESNTVK